METNKPSEQTTAPITIPLGILDVRLASRCSADRGGGQDAGSWHSVNDYFEGPVRQLQERTRHLIGLIPRHLRRAKKA